MNSETRTVQESNFLSLTDLFTRLWDFVSGKNADALTLRKLNEELNRHLPQYAQNRGILENLETYKQALMMVERQMSRQDLDSHKVKYALLHRVEELRKFHLAILKDSSEDARRVHQEFQGENGLQRRFRFVWEKAVPKNYSTDGSVFKRRS